MNDAGKTAEIFLEDGRDPQQLLEALVPRLTIRRFDIREPSLHEIFVRRPARLCGGRVSHRIRVR